MASGSLPGMMYYDGRLQRAVVRAQISTQMVLPGLMALWSSNLLCLLHSTPISPPQEKLWGWQPPHQRSTLPGTCHHRHSSDTTQERVHLCAEGWGADERLGKSMLGQRHVMAHFCLWGPLCLKDACCLQAAKFSHILSARMYAPE